MAIPGGRGETRKIGQTSDTQRRAKHRPRMDRMAASKRLSTIRS
jgi:hypothetical protein